MVLMVSGFISLMKLCHSINGRKRIVLI